jgi:hypothetical protein
MPQTSSNCFKSLARITPDLDYLTDGSKGLPHPADSPKHPPKDDVVKWRHRVGMSILVGSGTSVFCLTFLLPDREASDVNPYGASLGEIPL